MKSLRGIISHTIELGRDKPSLIECAFQLARTGEYSNKASIIEALKREGYEKPGQMLQGLMMARQLREAAALGRARIAQENPS